MMNMADIQDKLVKEGCFRQTVRMATPVFQNGKATSSATTSVTEFGPKLNNGGLMEFVETAKRGTKSRDHNLKKVTKSKPHEKAINNLQQEGWTMVKRGRNQVTLVKLPEREPSQVSNIELVSKSAGTKTDLSSKKTLCRFLRKSRKLLKGMFVCGRKEE